MKTIIKDITITIGDIQNKIGSDKNLTKNDKNKLTITVNQLFDIRLNLLKIFGLNNYQFFGHKYKQQLS